MALPNGHIGRVLGSAATSVRTSTRAGRAGQSSDMKRDLPYWPAALRLGQAASYFGLSVHMLKAVCPIKPIEFTQSSGGNRYLRARAKTMPDRGRVHFDLGNRQATFYPEVASDIDVVVRLLYLVEVISAKPTTAKIATGATTTISFRKNVPAMSIAGENCLPAVGEIQPMTMRIARRRIAPARARIKMIANSSPPATLRRRPGLAPTDTTLVIAARNSPAVVPSGAPRWRFSASLIWRASWNSWREIPTPGRCQLSSVPGGNSRQIISKTRNFTPRLRCVIFVGRPPLCPRLDIKRIALRAVGGADQFVVGLLRLRKPRLKLRCSIGNDSTVAGVEFIDRLNLRS